MFLPACARPEAFLGTRALLLWYSSSCAVPCCDGEYSAQAAVCCALCPPCADATDHPSLSRFGVVPMSCTHRMTNFVLKWMDMCWMDFHKSDKMVQKLQEVSSPYALCAARVG